MKINKISKQDIFEVAKSLNISLNSRQVDDVLEMYESELSQDPTATWDLIVENCIYTIIERDFQ